MKKRLLSWLMVLTLCLTLLPTAALAVGNEGGTGSTGGESESGSTLTEGHTHCLCGATHENVGNHTSNTQTTFDKQLTSSGGKLLVNGTEQEIKTVGEKFSAYVLDEGSYYLGSDLELECEIWVTSGTVNLCLNGKTITRSSRNEVIVVGTNSSSAVVATLTDCKGGGNTYGKVTHSSGESGRGVFVYANSTFNMYGGSIAGNHDTSGGGVTVSGIFQMYGGSITGNMTQERSGGGVFINGGGKFAMYGGSITGNSTGKNGGGVYANIDIETGGNLVSTVIVSGNATIAENVMNGTLDSSTGKYTGNTASNLYLAAYNGKRVTVSIGTDGLDDNARIGVTTETAPQDNSPVTIATGATAGKDYSGIIVSDISGYEVAHDSNDATKLVLKVADTPTPPVEEHEHYLCGTTHTDIGNHTSSMLVNFDKKLTSGSDGQLYVNGEEVSTENAYYALSAGNYYLADDITINKPILVNSDTVHLCLNGKSITLTQESEANTYVIACNGRATLNLTDCKPDGTAGTITHGSGKYGGGVEMYIGSTFNLYGGSITGNRSLGRTGGGVNAYGTFNMYGGSITGNCAEGNYSGYSGGGVYVNQGCKFHMYGGEISGNTATENGGGVYVGSTFTVSGAAKITNNTKGTGSNSTANNVYLPEANTTLVGVIGALTDGAEIGVTPKEWPEGDGKTAIAAGKEHATSETCYTIEDSDKACFKSDNSDYEISLVSNVLVLTKKGGSTTTEKQDQAALTLAADKSTLAVGETLTLTVTGGSSTGAVTYTVSDTEKATISGKTLTAKKAGTITVKATKAGDETYNDIDSNTITITIAEKSADPTPSTPSSSGSSSSGPRIIKTETRTAPDGSVTKTETWSNGTVTETTTGKDGSTTKITTKKDGSSVTESKAADGTTGTVKTDKNGRTEAAAKVSNKAVEDAKKSGEAVKVPTEVKAGEDSNSAPTVKVELPKNAGETKIEIPVSDANSGTVAVIVHPDGTEEIVKDSKPTEDGVQLTVDGSATIKIIDNSKDFIDTRDHWSRDEVNFVVARELFNGVGNDLFGVNQPMTRGMVNTVLARLAGVDTTPSAGQKWYEVGTAWAKANGITDGTNPEASVTREQLATLLYRFYGSPAVSGTLSFADAGAVSDYAQNALLWATQNGILNGVGNNRVAPGADAQRAQVAAMMARYLKNAG